MTPLFVAIYIVVTFLQFIIMKYMISDAIKKAKNKKARVPPLTLNTIETPSLHSWKLS